MAKQGERLSKEIQREYAYAVVRLCACAINGEKPDPSWAASLDLKILYRVAKGHLLTGIVAYSLEAAGIFDKAFTQDKGKAIRKVTALDVEKEQILALFEKKGIWYMPLKGSLLKDIYPEVGMRQMSDHDILFDVSRAEDVRRIMEGLGFETVKYDRGAHDSYHKEPVCNFEMHRRLFQGGLAKRTTKLAKYYQNVEGRLIRKEGCERRFSTDDFYVYVIAHAYKHYAGGGTGMRTLLDTYVYLKHFGKEMNWEYIAAETEKLGIGEFERAQRSLAQHLFEGEELTEDEKELFDYFLSSGTYGTHENNIRNELKNTTKAGYLLRNIFPSLEYMKQSVYFVKVCPLLYPIGIVYRWGRILILRRSYLKTVLRVVREFSIDNSKR